MSEFKKITNYLWEIARKDDMLVPARVYADENLLKQVVNEKTTESAFNAVEQLKNVAALPGIEKYSLAMADIHPGYGFPIGGVGAFDLDKGVIAVGGVGFDINCGVRTMATNLTLKDVEKDKEKIADALFKIIPAGVGSTGELRLSPSELDEVMVNGAEFSVKRGYGFKSDLEFIEEWGKVSNAKPEFVSDHAKKRDLKQVGTLGAGNHYLEVQYVDEVNNTQAAKAYGLFHGQILVSIHCGSRALGHQIGTDYLKTMSEASKKYNIPIKEKEMVCAPFRSKEGQEYFGAVNAGINGAFANRQVLGHLTRVAFEKSIGYDPKEFKVLYEIGHNTVKLETHKVDGKLKEVLVHRKGATRAFGPGRDEVSEKYRDIGQPVLIGGTMGTSSYILHGTKVGMDESFGSACHGAGRQMSRQKAKGEWRGNSVINDLKKQGIVIKGHSLQGIAEEAPGAYKDVSEVIEVMVKSGIIGPVVRTRPLICIKG